MHSPAEAGAPRVTVLNAVALNAGDAAILAGLRAALLGAFGPELDLHVADDAPVAARALYPEVQFAPGLHGTGLEATHPLRGAARSIHRWQVRLAVRMMSAAPRVGRSLLDRAGRAHLDCVARSTAAVSTGGTYFVEHYGFERRAVEVLAAQSTGVPTILYTQSLGPFTRNAARRLMRRVLGGCAAVFLRDERSRGHALELGVDPAKLHVRPDAAFVLAQPAAERQSRGPLRVAVSVRDWARFGDRGRSAGAAAYAQAVAGTVRSLVRDDGAEVTFLSTCQGVPAYWTDDARVAQRIVDELLSDVSGVRVDGAFRSPVELRDRYAQFDLVIATRMHAAILALCAGTPVVPIAYEFKTSELFESLGMGQLVDDIATLSGASLRTRTRDALDRLASLQAHIRTLLPSLRSQAAEPAERIRAMTTR